MAVASFRQGLKRTNKLRSFLTKKPPKGTFELLQQIHEYVTANEEELEVEQAANQPKIKNKKKDKIKNTETRVPKKKVYHMESIVFKEPIHKLLPLIKDQPWF